MREVTSFVIGNGFTKTWSRTKQQIFPSVVATEQAGIDFTGFKAGSDFVIEFEGNRLAIGETAWKLGRMRATPMDRNRVNTPFFRQLFAAALVSTVEDGTDIEVILTLPVAWYSKRDEVREMLSGVYVIKMNKKVYTYHIGTRNLRIIPEGFGVLASQMLDDQGCIDRREIASATVGIVEIGTATTDLSLFQALELIPVKSRGIPYGLKEVWESVQADILAKYERELELHKIDQAIRSGAFKDSGRIIDVKPFTKKRMPELAQSIASEIGNLWEGGRLADGIFFAGGGGPQCYPYFDYKHGQLVDSSHTADAYGAYLYGLFRSKQGK